MNFAKFFRKLTLVENLYVAAFGNAFLYDTFGRLLLHFRGFNLCAEKAHYNFLLNLQPC